MFPRFRSRANLSHPSDLGSKMVAGCSATVPCAWRPLHPVDERLKHEAGQPNYGRNSTPVAYFEIPSGLFWIHGLWTGAILVCHN